MAELKPLSVAFDELMRHYDECVNNDTSSGKLTVGGVILIFKKVEEIY